MSKRNRKHRHETKYIPVRNKDGDITGWVCVITDRGAVLGSGNGATQADAYAAAKMEAWR